MIKSVLLKLILEEIHKNACPKFTLLLFIDELGAFIVTIKDLGHLAYKIHIMNHEAVFNVLYEASAA